MFWIVDRRFRSLQAKATSRTKNRQLLPALAHTDTAADFENSCSSWGEIVGFASFSPGAPHQEIPAQENRAPPMLIVGSKLPCGGHVELAESIRRRSMFRGEDCVTTDLASAKKG